MLAALNPFRTFNVSTIIVCGIGVRAYLKKQFLPAVRMERKNYSLSRPVPRQTLWNLRQRAKRSEAASSSLGDRGTSDSSSQEHDAEEILLHPKQKRKRVGQESQPVDEGRCPGGSLLDEQHIQDSHLINFAPEDMSNVTANTSVLHMIPRLKPVRYESDHEGVNSSSDDDDGGLFGINKDRNSDSMSSSHGEESDTSSSDEDSDGSSYSSNMRNVQCESSTPWLLPNHPMGGSVPFSKEESPSYPPEVKYSALVHMLKTKHGLTKEAVEDTMEIINDFSMLTLNKPVLPNDARTLEKTYEPYLTSAQKHFLCVGCGSYIGIQKEGDVSYTCEICYSLCCFKNSEYFFYLPLADQLRQLFEYNYGEVSVAFENREIDDDSSHLIRSIRDDRKYKEYRSEMSEKGKCISLTFSCDGVPVFSSSGSSLWPCLCTINELDMPLRKKHVLVAGLFYGVDKKKP